MDSIVHAGGKLALCHAPPGSGLRLSAALERHGFDVLTCRNTEALIEHAVQSAPDLIGYTLGSSRRLDAGVLRLLRRFWPDPPFLIVCKHATLEDRRLVQELRPIFLLLEPWNEEELNELLASLQAPRSRRVFYPPPYARGSG